MKQTLKKTNAARILDSAGINYEIAEYEVDENHLSAEAVAEKIGFPPGQVFKTLVVRGDKSGVFLACIPGEADLDLKNLAVVTGNKRVELVPLKDVQILTGYIRGGVSPLGTKKQYKVLFDDTVQLWPVISISAGSRGCQLIVCPQKLIRVLNAVVYPIARI